MNAEPAIYAKLPGRGLRRSVFAISATRSRLWLAPDHLLAVDYTIASEEYRRFYFRDIEALIVRRTARRQIWNWILLGLILITAGPFVLAWNLEGSGGFLIVAISVAAFWLLFMIVNTVRGATCEAHIRTAVQLEQLPSLGRLPAARKVLDRLQPLIVAAQGAATAEELAGAPWMVASATPAVKPDARPNGATAVRADKGWLHGALFGLLIIEAILTATAYIFVGEPISMFSVLAMLGGCVMSVVALVRQGETDLSSAVRTVTKVSVGYYVLKCLVGFIYMMIFAVRHPGEQLVTGLEMIGETGFAETALGSAGLGAVIGLIGFVALLGHLRRPTTPPAAT